MTVEKDKKGTKTEDEKGAKVETTFRAVHHPDVVMDATPPVDATKCQCTNVARRWDTDGLIEPGKYRCSECGKWYA